MKIQIDDREDKDNKIKEYLKLHNKIKDIEYEVLRLHIGDYAIIKEDKILHVFERKSMNDLVNSIKTKNMHLDTMLEIKKELGCKIAYIIESKKIFYSDDTILHGIPFSKIKAYLDMIYIQHDIPVIWTKDQYNTIDQIINFTIRYKKLDIQGGSCASNLRVKKEKTDEDIVFKMWMVMPGVGEETASALIKTCSILEFVNIDTSNILINGKKIGCRLDNTQSQLNSNNNTLHKKILCAIPGISETKALRILKEYEFLDLVNHKDDIINMTFSGRKLGKVGSNIFKYLNYHS